MNDKPKNLTEAINELETHSTNGRGGLEEVKEAFEAELRRIEETLRSLKPNLDELSEKASSHAKKTKTEVEQQVSKNPWAALGIVGLVFFVIGFLLGSSRRGD